MTEARRRGPAGRLLLSLLTLLALAVLVGLGVWQVQRLQWKTELIARIEALRSAPARPLASLLADRAAGGDVDYARAISDCPGLDTARSVELYALQDRVTGARIISACPVQDGPYAFVLVDRGFAADAELPLKPIGAAEAEHRPVVGVLRSPDADNPFTPKTPAAGGRFYSRDMAPIAQALGVTGTVAPVYLFLESPPPPGGLPRPVPVPTDIGNRHLGYAITWFGLAAALAGVYLAVMLKRTDRA
ncbi:MAG: SURF1 family protein [Proteobacteria bacterium]|nr:SURF1 family protein [Pseudomonadota bacterium]MBW3616482.1 SURF1 family protein [Pseudomonadota bacterium]